ncbi:cyclic nucleotide-binding domain-containing protein [Pseudovibrio sp. Alg231-02]|uniref:cyclic nucleotide-binding domain-containing protein n=1 Tax=Pseudovibrio sp. Alg231-02 TaxID=1922223 RepID=UPI000D553E56|nr:cyclic nucleotide-binding domain-containing protein [Pseudovibrio sp. Alg231-02]
MPIRVSITKDPEQIDSILKLRYDLFCLQEKLFQPTNDQRIVDKFDMLSTTRNMLAMRDDKIIGALRINVDSPAGVPADNYYDFRQHLPKENVNMMSVGMFCVREAQRSLGIALHLISLSAIFAVSNDITHVIAPTNPAISKLVTRVGFKPVGDMQYAPHLGGNFIPMMLDMRDLADNLQTFAQRTQLYNFLQSYEYMLFSKGETVLQAGAKGDTGFVIIEGEAEVRHAASGDVLGVLGQGQFFGETALLTDNTQSADVIATSHLQTMVLPKDAFLDHLRVDPTQMQNSFDHRMNAELLGLPQQKYAQSHRNLKCVLRRDFCLAEPA